MNSRRIRLALTLLLPAAVFGCNLLDRESYSIMIRKPAHLYERPVKAPPAEPGDAAMSDSEPDSPEPDLSAYVRDDLDRLIEGLAPPLVPFRPFAYCHLHETSHPLESMVAYLLAPVEYPLALATNFTYLTIDTTIMILMAPLDALFGPPEAPLREEERRKPTK